MDDVLVVGGGLAGLACAAELDAAGVPCTVLEAADEVGGRVRTDVVDGFRIDRGFQVLLTAYPEAQRLLDHEALELRRFAPGALIRFRGRFRRLADPWRRPLDAVGSLLDGTVPIGDALRVARLRRRVRRGPVEAIFERRGRPTAERLAAEGFSAAVVERFFRPFFGGVFLDPGLATSDRQLEFVFRMFSAGATAVPALGMGEIPRQLAARLPPGAVRAGCRVASVAADGVELASGERLGARAVVVAADADAARALVGEPAAPGWRSVTQLAFAAAEPPIQGPWLVLDGERGGPVNNLAVMSEVSARLAPPGQALVSATVLGIPTATDDELAAAVRTQLAGWFGDAVGGWRLLKVDRIERALPDQSPPDPDPGGRPHRLDSGIYLCGDHRTDGSINGAMASGRRVAQLIAAASGPPG